MLRFFIFGSIQGILSRNEKDLGAKFPEVKEGVAQDAVIDGEIVALDDKGRCLRDANLLRTRGIPMSCR
jgi:ATP-dependent DNA ligase